MQHNENLEKTSNNLIKGKREKFRVEFRKQNNELLLNQKRNFQSFHSPSSSLIIIETPIEETEKIVSFAKELYLALESQNKINIFKNVKNLRVMTCKIDNPPFESIINTQILPHIIKLLGSKNKEYSEIQLEALWLFTNLSTGNIKIIRYLIENNLLLYLKEIIATQEDMSLIDQSIMCCANIASEIEYRDVFIIQEFDLLIQKILITRKEDLSKNLYRNISFFLVNISRKNRQYLERIVPFLDTIAQFLYVEDEETVIESTWTLFNIAELDYYYLMKVISIGVITKIIKNLSNPNDKMKWASLRLISLIAGGPDPYTEILYQNNIYVHLSGILDNARPTLRKEALYIASNLVAEDKEQWLENFIDSDVFHKVLKISKIDEIMVVKEAIYVLTNFINSATPVLIKKFVYKGGLTILIELIDKFIDEKDVFVMNMLGAIDRILGTEGKDEMEFIREFAENGGIRVIKTGKEKFWENMSEKCIDIYNKYIRENFI